MWTTFKAGRGNPERTNLALGGTRKPRENKFGACVGSRETGFWFAIGPGARGLVALLNLADLGVLRLAPFVAKPLGATLLIGRNSGWNRIQCVCVQGMCNVTENAVSPLLLRARAQLGRIPNV